MRQSGFYSPVKLVFGQPVAAVLPSALVVIGAERVLVLSDGGLDALGLVDQVAGRLRAGGLQVTTFA